MPEVIQHKGASLSRLVSHMWLTTEGVYGVALGVSVQFIFLFVLFGTLLDIAGAGNYMMQVSVALLGHLRGGPAKVAVVSSALNGAGVRLLGVQRGLGRHLHDPADEAHRLLRREGGRHRGGLVDQRADHAAGDGGGRVPHGRVRRHPVHRRSSSTPRCRPSSRTWRSSTSCTWRRSSTTSSRSRAARPSRPAGPAIDRGRPGIGRARCRRRRPLLRRHRRAAAVRARRRAGSWPCSRAAAISASSAFSAALPGPADRRSERADHPAARAVAHRARGISTSWSPWSCSSGA